ncbi:hypothetical protein AAG570_013366 [Ranatra chinensis]|uniref:Uncharacterized protein n=1 Tax=Ranatra chinensis TaxID=642074 RepID=A0ABD0YNM5_9HEMI
MGSKHGNIFYQNKKRETMEIGSWLRTLILTEGIDISAFELTQLAEVCKGDVRQALLQLQFCSSSNMSSKQLLLRERTDLRSIWERVGEYDMRKKKELMKLRRVLKSLSAADTISQKISLLDKSVWPSYLDGCLKDSTCIEENFLPPHDLLGVAIVEELQTIVGSMTPPAGNENTLISSAAATKRAQTNFELEKGIGCVSVLSRRSLATDYFSAIREMAVSENYRLANQTKRNNRIVFHVSNNICQQNNLFSRYKVQ